MSLLSIAGRVSAQRYSYLCTLYAVANRPAINVAFSRSFYTRTPMDKNSARSKLRALHGDKKIQPLDLAEPLIRQPMDIAGETGLQIMANAKILTALEHGEFDNLKGAGKKIKYNVGDMPSTHPDYLVGKVLKNSGFVPRWMELSRDIDDHIRAMRAHMTKESAISPEDTKMIQDINAEILKFNLSCPGRFQRVQHKLELEWERSHRHA